MNGIEQRERGTQVQRLDSRIDSLDRRVIELATEWDAEIKEQVDKLNDRIVSVHQEMIGVLTSSITAEGKQRQADIEELELQLRGYIDNEINHIWVRLNPVFTLTFRGRLRWLLTGKL
jgi:hypothetical protein